MTAGSGRYFGATADLLGRPFKDELHDVLGHCPFRAGVGVGQGAKHFAKPLRVVPIPDSLGA